MADGTSIAQLIIFIPLALITLFCLFTHGKSGILGWGYLNVLCIIRIVAAAVIIHDESQGSGITVAALVLSSVGLSPLLLAASGILHEARRGRDRSMNNKIEWTIVINYHMLVSAGIVLVIIGVVNLGEGEATTTTNSLIKAGAALLILAWVLLIIASVFSFVGRTANKSDVSFYNGSKLLYAVVAVLPLIGLRIVYAATYLILETTDPTAEFSRSLAVRTCLSVVPEILVVVILAGAGLWSKNIKRSPERSRV